MNLKKKSLIKSNDIINSKSNKQSKDPHPTIYHGHSTITFISIIYFLGQIWIYAEISYKWFTNSHIIACMYNVVKLIKVSNR